MQDILMAKFLCKFAKVILSDLYFRFGCKKSYTSLQKYDLAVIAKPNETFTDAEKQVLDQFIMNGGKTLWLIDQVSAKWTVIQSELLWRIHEI
jgi:hypothetical protein